MAANEWVVGKDTSAAGLAFSKQAVHFDSDDLANPILREWRMQVYAHVNEFLKPSSQVLELNAGTGLDAFYFASLGHRVHATDLSSGMVKELNKKIAEREGSGVSCQQVSVEHLNEVGQNDFDFIFSNFGGLNCIQDLSLVSRHLSKKIKPGGYITWVIMPMFCPWELLRLLKLEWRESVRRFHKNGTLARVEGNYFKVYYHSLSTIRKALGKSFVLVRTEGLGSLSAPPAAMSFYQHHPRLYRVLRKMDLVMKDYFPFNRWGDHIIVTFRKSVNS